MSDSPIHRAVRGVTAPFRDYLNNHFEMVKTEVRERTVVVEQPEFALRLAELETTVSESVLHETRVLAQLRDETSDLAKRVEELERLVERLVDIAAVSSVAAADDTPR